MSILLDGASIIIVVVVVVSTTRGSELTLPDRRIAGSATGFSTDRGIRRIATARSLSFSLSAATRSQPAVAQKNTLRGDTRREPPALTLTQCPEYLRDLRRRGDLIS